MRYRLQELVVDLDYHEEELRKRAASALRLEPAVLHNFKVIRRSLDARRQPVFSFVVEFESATPLQESRNLRHVPEERPAPVLKDLDLKAEDRPLVVGAGPAGLMAALVLARNGLKPILIDRGSEVARRSGQVEKFWRGGALNPESNVLFGEGGAGLFSDGKLTARSKDRQGIQYFLETLVSCGADPGILVEAEPHVGTDQLKQVVPRLVKLIVDAGGEVRFDARLENIALTRGRLSEVTVNRTELAVQQVVLATGLSATDVYEMLASCGSQLDPKAFAVGVRVELPQEVVNRQQYGRYSGHARLGPASFRLTRRAEAEARACYSFCMCPGGYVIPCSSSADAFTTNGMSYADRASPCANAAFLVPVEPADFGNTAAGGLEFRQRIERLAFESGGSDYGMPATSLTRFLKPDNNKPVCANSPLAKTREADLGVILPNFVTGTLRHALPQMLNIFGGLNRDDVALYAAETRSSSPVRIVRGPDGQASGVAGLFPCGEGAGYAGGIVSSALDGIRQAENLIRTLV